jgi:hypothetical protein
MRPTRPKKLPQYAVLCLQALGGSRLGAKLSLGGAVGLMHYFEYRLTNDVDAWWMEGLTNDEREQLVDLIETTLSSLGEVKTRAWGDVVSIELYVNGKAVFSFQIAGRSAQLEPSQSSPWGTILLDSLSDLVASKMVALIERGAPRDFRDIYALCHEAVVTPEECWRLWRQRQTLAGSDSSLSRAELAIQTHLARIERHRPLELIDESAARQTAEQLRTWFKTEFLQAAGGEV